MWTQTFVVKAIQRHPYYAGYHIGVGGAVAKHWYWVTGASEHTSRLERVAGSLVVAAILPPLVPPVLAGVGVYAFFDKLRG